MTNLLETRRIHLQPHALAAYKTRFESELLSCETQSPSSGSGDSRCLTSRWPDERKVLGHFIVETVPF